MIANNMSFNPVNFKGTGKVDGLPVFLHQFPLTKGGYIDLDAAAGTAKFGRVVCVEPTEKDAFKVGKTSDGVVVGMLLADPSIMKTDPTMNDYYFAGRPATVATFGLVQLADWDNDVTGAVAPSLGVKVVFNNTTGQIGFLAAGTASAPSGYTLLDAKVYDYDGANGVTLFVNFI